MKEESERPGYLGYHGSGPALPDRARAIQEISAQGVHAKATWSGSNFSNDSGSGLSGRGVFRSVRELKGAIDRFLDQTNNDPKPFTWTADPDKIAAAVKRGHQLLDSFH